MSPQTSEGERREYLVFALATGRYAITVLKLKEILQYQELTTLPSAPRFIRGVLNLRGRVVPVVDLAVKFGLPKAAVTKRTCVLVVEADIAGTSYVIGLIADAVHQVVGLRAQDIEPPPRLATEGRAEFMEGIGKLETDLVVILDIDRLLTPEERELASDVALEAGKQVEAGATV